MPTLFIFYSAPDIDECSQGSHSCSGNAACLNVMAGFQCSCLPGYIGSGFVCSGEFSAAILAAVVVIVVVSVVGVCHVLLVPASQAMSSQHRK